MRIFAREPCKSQARARKHRAQNRSGYNNHEDSSTGLMRPSREKTFFRGALKLAEYMVYTGVFEAGNFHGGEKTVGREVLCAH